MSLVLGILEATAHIAKGTKVTVHTNNGGVHTGELLEPHHPSHTHVVVSADRKPGYLIIPTHRVKSVKQEGEMGRAFGALKNMRLTLMQYPTGRWGFVGGGIPIDLAYKGPDFEMRMPRTWGTEAEARAAAKEYGITDIAM
jgi:hypothetical protein